MPSSPLYTQNNKHYHVELMQESLILQCTCNCSLVFPSDDTILGTSMPPPLLPLLLLLNHSQCASLSWPRTERERKLSVRDNILITILTAPTHAQYTPLYTCTANILGFGNHYSKHNIMSMTLKNIICGCLG